MIPKSRDAQRATLRRQIGGLMRDLEAGMLDGVTISIARGESDRRLERVRSDRDERALHAILELLARLAIAKDLRDIVNEVAEVCLSLGMRNPADAQEILRAWSYSQTPRRSKNETHKK